MPSPIRRPIAAWLASATWLAASLIPQSAAHAWGSTGHRIIGRLGVATLPDALPAFLRTPQAIETIGELAREPDRSRGSGRVHDNTRDPGHFVDLNDDGTLLSGQPLSALPATRTDYETALRAAGTETSHAGYLPYSIIDGWQQLAKDFAYWRVESAAIPRETNPERKAWLEADLQRRETLTIHDLGIWSHFVGDASQPMHVSIHYDGWGKFPNPNGYTLERVHVPFEGPFVRRFVSEDAAKAAMAPLKPCLPIEACTIQYLTQTAATVTPFFDMQKAGGLAGSDPAGRVFAVQRIAAGAAALRDMTVSAWEASAHGAVGYPALTVDQVVSDKIDPFNALYGDD